MRYASAPSLSAVYAAWVALVVICTFLLPTGAAQAQPLITLSDNQQNQDVSAASMMWTDPAGKSTIAQVLAGRTSLAFSPSRAETVHTLGEGGALWQHYRFALPRVSKEQWVLEFPLTLLDRITVYQKSDAGQWESLTAGDTVPVADWPTPGRYAQFNLNFQEIGAHDVYVQIRNASNISVPARVTTNSQQTQRLQVDYLVVGTVLGALLLLIVTCLTQSWTFRDLTYSWYAAYALLLMLTMSAWTGVAGHMFWTNWGRWSDLAPGCLGVLTGSSALLFIRHICCGSSRKRWFDTLLFWFGLSGLPVAIAYALMERTLAVNMISVYLTTVAALGITKAVSTWRRKDVIGLWLLAAFSPTALATLVLIGHVMGFMPSNWLTRYGLMIGLIIEVPLLLIALNMRSRQRHTVEARAQAIPTRDALTGLLTAHLFQDRLQQTVTRLERHKEPAAVVYIKLINYSYIKKTFGVAVAEQSLLRSVIKLRRLLRDVDTVGRVDEAVFGLILEGNTDRNAVTELSAQLIAAGLMPLKGLKPDVILQFHAAAVLLGERAGTAIAVDADLTELIKYMDSHTRRPIRFLEPENTRPMNLEELSEHEAAQSDPGGWPASMKANQVQLLRPS